MMVELMKMVEQLQLQVLELAVVVAVAAVVVVLQQVHSEQRLLVLVEVLQVARRVFDKSDLRSSEQIHSPVQTRTYKSVVVETTSANNSYGKYVGNSVV